MPIAEFDLTQYSVIKDEIYSAANMDVYAGNLSLITGRNVSDSRGLGGKCLSH